jgi:hypothetical protein
MRPLRAQRCSGSRRESRTGDRHGGGLDRRLPLMAGALMLVLLLLAATAGPAEAQGGILGTGISIPNPLSPIPGPISPGGSGGVSSLLGGLNGDLAKLAVGGFDAIVKALFAPIAKFITTQLIGWLVAVPNLTQGNVTALEQTVEAMGGGLLGAVATISTIRYWTAGFAGGGDSGFAALEGLARTVGAALFLAVWPWVFDTAVSLTNQFTSSLLGSGAVVHSVSHLLAAGLGAGIALNFTSIGLFLNIAMAVAASLLFLGLLLVKIVVSLSTILVFVGMPLAVVVWPVVPWIARAAMRAFAVCLLVPVMWALCFAASAAVSLNAISFNAGTVMNALLEPLVAIVLLWVMLRLPIHLAKVAMLGAAPLGGGFASRAVSYAAGSQLRDTARQHLPAWAGGQPTSSNEQPAQAESRTGTRLRQAATLAGASATGGATGAAAAAAGGGASTGTAAGGSAGSTAAGPGSGGKGRSYTPPPSAQAHAAGQAAGGGLQTPSFREPDFANETFEARFRERTSPVSAEQAQTALQSLPADTQRGIGQLVSEHGAGAREHLAYQALGDWSPREREALRTLAAASPEIRSQALGDTAGTHDQHDGSTSVGATDQGAAGEQQRSSAPFGATQPASTPQPASAGSPSRPTPVDLPDPAAPPRPTPTPPHEPGDGPQGEGS